MMFMRNQNFLIKDINSYTITFKICRITVTMSCIAARINRRTSAIYSWYNLNAQEINFH